MNRIIKKDNLMCSGVYAIKCINTNKYYIGSSGAVCNRYKQHVNMLEKGRHHNRGLQADYNNGNYFEISIVHKIELGVPSDLIIVSEYLTMIELYKSDLELYNIESIPTDKPPLEYFNSVIMGYVKRFCDIEFDAHYYAYIENKRKS